MRQIFKYIFISFSFSFISSLKITKEESKIKKVLKRMLMIFNIFMTCLVIFSMIFKSAMAISNTIMVSSKLIYRWVLCIRLEKFKGIASSLCSRSIKEDPIAIRWGYAWILTSKLILISLLAYYFATETYASKRLIFLGHEIEKPYSSIISALLFVHTVVHFNVAINAFSIFYVTVCRMIRSEILKFTKKVTQSKNTDFESLMRSYTGMASMVEYIDDSMSFLMFCSTVFSSASLYFTTTVVLHPETIGGRLERYVLTIGFFLVTIVPFMAMAVSASLVSEASLRVSSRVKALTPESLASAIQLQRFISLTDKDLCLTVWKIAPIRRNFIISTLGCVFTYIVLFDGLTMN